MSAIQELILKNLPVGLLVIDRNGKIIEASPSACTILGCPMDDFKSRQWGEIFLSRQENLEFSEVVLDAIQNETPTVERVTPYLAPNGDQKYLSVISSAEREDGKITAIVVLFEDLTELHRLNQREKHILEVNHRLAKQRAESLIAFAQSVAHQVRNPLMAIAGFSRLLERNANETEHQSLEAIREEATKLESMVRAVAEYSAIVVGPPIQVNLWVVIEDAKHRIAEHPAVANQGIDWQADCPDMSIKADRDLTALALSEVLLNAAEFAGPKATIRICAKEVDATIKITVTDNGPGFTREGLGMAFDPFFTTKASGAGMGLTRARLILNGHQGTMDIDNHPEGGARVTMTLPVEPLPVEPLPQNRDTLSD
ncbi:sensor histidine kinase [Pseudodesulfovibrio sp.]|uniref:sensor histidine kinase n=1 Tax=unclassified Pseudodesulfovibrio TaxID=2661612 RepID=UPI003B008894